MASLERWAEDVERWAGETLRPRTAQRYRERTIDAATWSALAGRGLLGLLSATDRDERGPVALYLASAAVARGSRDAGLVLSWLVQELLIAHQLGPENLRGRRDELLQRYRRGETRVALAVSEARRGAHPRYIETTATRSSEGGWTLRGQKVLCTNGPLADELLVVAKTRDGGDGGRHELTAFFVDAAARGIALEPMAIPFCQSCPHGIVRLDDVDVGDDAIVGEEGSAYAQLIKPFRELEDSYALGLFVGHLSWLVDELAELALGARGDRDDEVAEAVAAAAAQLHGARLAAHRCARARALGEPPLREQLARNAAQLALDGCRAALEELSRASGARDDEQLTRGLADLQLASVARGVRRRLRARTGRALYPAAKATRTTQEPAP